MEKTGLPAVLCALTLLLLSLMGCGGGASSSSTPEASTSVLLSGVVEDGPIENAKISLRNKENLTLDLCGPQGNIRCETATDSAGTFSLEVPAGIDLADLSVVAVDGRDRATGVDFTSLEMRSPLALFTDDVSAMVISPLTTLIAKLKEQGATLAVAQNRLREWLALPAATTLAARPSASLDLQRRTLLLSKIALEIKAVASTINPFSHITTQMLLADTLDAATANPEIMNALGLDVAAQTRVRDLHLLLAASSTVDTAVFIFKREELMGIFAANIEQMLIDSTSFDPLNTNYRENLRLLTELTLQAAGSEVITLGGTIPQRIARYILFTYQLRTWEILTLAPAIFAENLALLANDPWVAELARSRSLYSVVSPLLLTELPGNDNQQRLAYFYGSDLSPHFQAEQLIGQVYDDAINDAVLLKIVEGKANAGLIDETRTIIATQIVQSEPKAHAYRSLANALIKFNHSEEALPVLDLARDLYRDVVIAHKRASLTITSDVTNLIATSVSYRKAGDLLNAQSLLDDVAVMAQDPASDAIIYGKLITGIKNVADAYIAAGDLEAAAPLVEAMDYYSGQTLALGGTYKLRIYNWSESAKRYADLGNSQMVEQVVNQIQALRNTDAITAAVTWVYLPDLVESLYRAGRTQSALALAATIPGDSPYLSKAFKLVATYEALQGNIGTAFSIVDNLNYVAKDEDRVELLTYFSTSRPYIAQVLISAGSFSEARLALEKAEVILEGMTSSNNLVRISNGYVKVAELYALMGDNANAAALLQKAQGAIINDVYRVAVMVDIALGYYNISQPGAALTLLDSARSLAEANPTLFRANTSMNLGTEEYATLLYDKLIMAYEQMGEKSSVRTTVNLFLPWAQGIHLAGTVNDPLAIKECDYLLRAALYLDRAGYHEDALNVVAAAKESAAQIVIDSKRLAKYLSVVTTYAAVHENDQALTIALALSFTSERNQGIQTLANAYIDRDDFPDSVVANIDSDGDDQPDFFHPLASAADIAASGLLLDDDSDGDGIVDTLDLRPLFVD